MFVMDIYLMMILLCYLICDWFVNLMGCMYVFSGGSCLVSLVLFGLILVGWGGWLRVW